MSFQGWLDEESVNLDTMALLCKDSLEKAYNAGAAESTNTDTSPCTWAQETSDDHDRNVWEPSCGGSAWVLEDGGPHQLGMKHCHFCGRLLVEKPYRPEDEDALN